MTPSTSSSEVWNKINRLKGRPSGTISGIFQNENWIESRKDIPEIFASHFYETFKPNSPDVIDISPIRLIEDNIYNYNSPFTHNELEVALHTCRDSAPGLDSIRTSLIKNLPLQGITYLLNLYNEIWTKGHLPLSWKKSIIIPIHKPTKSRFKVDSYRPIALTSHLCKILERMVNNRLTWLLEKHNLLANEQMGFRKGRSTLDHLVNFEITLQNSFNKNQHTTAVFLDLASAFNTIKRSKIIESLTNWGISGNMINFIKAFLSDRTFQVRTNNYLSKTYSQPNGVPQGSVISPTLFIIAMNSIKSNLPNYISLKLFADDILIHHSSTEYIQSENIIQNSLNSITNWAKNQGMSFSPTKSACVHFCRKRDCPKITNLSIDNIQIPNSDSCKFLGLFFDTSLSWSKHIGYLKNKCNKDLNIIRLLSGSKWGSHRTSLQRIYNSLILSKMDYGCIAYASARKSVLKKLDPIHNSALRMILGAFRTSPIKSLYCESECPSLNNRREHLLMNYANNLRFRPFIPHWESFFGAAVPHHNLGRHTTLGADLRYKELVERLSITYPPAYKVNKYLIPPWNTPPIIVDKSLLNYPKNEYNKTVVTKAFLELINKTYKNYRTVYTDGSKTSDRVGSAIYTHSFSKSYLLHSTTSVFTAELFAISKAINFTLNQTHHKWIIATDSLSSIESLKSQKPSHPLIIDILNKIGILYSLRKEIIFVWIPSHMSIPGNEEADRMAKLGDENTIQVNNVFWERDIKNSETTILHNLLQLEWDLLLDDNKLLEVKERFFEKVDIRNIPRQYSCIMARLRIGHTLLTHKHLITKTDPPVCTDCNTLLTIRHIFSHCTKYSQILKSLDIQGTLKEKLAYTNTIKIVHFLKEVDLYKKI